MGRPPARLLPRSELLPLLLLVLLLLLPSPLLPRVLRAPPSPPALLLFPYLFLR